MKKYIFLLATLLLTACAISPDSPEIQTELRNAQRMQDYCLMEQIVKIDDRATDPYLLAKVAAGQCVYTSMQEAERLKNLNTNPYFIEGFVDGFTNKHEITDRALDLLIANRQGRVKPIKQSKK